MHYMAGAWAHRIREIERAAHRVFMENGGPKPLFQPHYAERLKTDYKKALEQFRYWELQD